MNKTNISTRIIALLSLLIIFVVNLYGYFIPLNGKTIPQIFMSYPNLLLPAGYSLYIWIPLYLLMTSFVVYQIWMFHKSLSRMSKLSIRIINYTFFVIALLNAIWTISFYYSYFALATLIVLLLLSCQIFVIRTISREELSQREKLFIKLPFSINCGWGLVSVILSFMVLFVSMGWSTSKNSTTLLAILFLLACSLSCLIIMRRYKTSSIGLAIVWVFVVILVQHISKDGFHGEYPMIIITAIFCVLMLVTAGVYQLVKKHE